MEQSQALPLHGVRVVDLSTVVFGPLASQNLADFGAEVIKIESPEGDSTRRTGPGAQMKMAALFLATNRSKKSVVLDLKQAPARAALMGILADADVFMHSMRPQKLAALGIDPQTLAARFPRLIYAALHGFGESGPYHGRPAYDDIIQGMSGLTSLTARQTGEARYLPTIAADKTCAQFAAQAILAALFRRERDGCGGFVEIPMFETMVAFNMVEHLYGQHFVPHQGVAGYERVLTRWRRPLPTSDGSLCMMPYTDTHWARFFAEVGRPELAEDPRFATMTARTQHIGELLELAGGFVRQHPTDHWIDACERLQIPASASIEFDQLIEDSHLSATSFFAQVNDPAMGEIRFPGVPVKFDRTRPPVRMAPRLGEHTLEVLKQAGLSEAEIHQLTRNGAASDAAPSAHSAFSNPTSANP